MRSGTKVIYFKSCDGQPAPARIGYVVHPLPSSGWMMLAEEPTGRAIIHVRTAHVHPYNESLWGAWRQWEQNAKLLQAQHRQLMQGVAPDELVTVGMW